MGNDGLKKSYEALSSGYSKDTVRTGQEFKAVIDLYGAFYLKLLRDRNEKS